MNYLSLYLFCLIFLSGTIFLSSISTSAEPSVNVPPVLVQAAMCEDVVDFSPVNESIIFSIDLRKVVSFTRFDPVYQKGTIYHKWFHNGKLVSAKKLTIKPPQWSSVSSMQLRSTDKGVWQVDITGDNGVIYNTLRFSITE